MSPTTEIHSGLFNRTALLRQIAILAAFLLIAMSCQSLFAQAPTPGKRATPARRQPDRRTQPVAPVEPEAEEAEEEEETPPAKEYKELTVDDTLKSKGSKVTPILTAGKFENPADQTMFDDYYRNYFLARWSLVDNIENLPRERKDLCNQLGKRSVGGSAVHDHLNDIVLEVMKTLASGDFHPAVRYNAVLMIGDLNSVEKVGSEKDVPLPDALKVLMGAAESGKLSDELRVAAMIGIARHARLNIQDEEVRASLSKSMLRLATAEIPAGPAASGREWIRAQAIETLGILGSVGENNSVFQAMLKAVADDKLPPFVRIAAVDALGRLNYLSANGINATEAAFTLGQYALDACDDELQSLKKPGSLVMRRRIMSSLIAVLSALGGEGDDRKGIASIAKEPNLAAELQKTIEEACKTLDQTEEDKGLKAPVADLQKKLKAWLQKKPK
jgi:hypothetical protein